MRRLSYGLVWWSPVLIAIGIVDTMHAVATGGSLVFPLATTLYFVAYRRAYRA